MNSTSLPPRLDAALHAAQPTRQHDRRVPFARDLDLPGIGQWESDLLAGTAALSHSVNALFDFDEDERPSAEQLRRRYHPEDRERVSRETAKVLADPARNLLQSTFRILRRDGEVRWIELRGTIIRDREGRATRMGGVLMDVTHLKSGHSALEESWRRFESALENSALCVFQQDLELRYTWIHDPRLGDGARAVLGQTDAALYDRETAVRLAELKRRAMQTGLPVHEEVPAATGDDAAILDMFVEPKRDDAGRTIGVVGASIALSSLKPKSPRPTALMPAPAGPSPAIATGQTKGGLVTICTNALRRKLAGSPGVRRETLASLSTLETNRRFILARRELDTAAADGAPGTAWLLGSGWMYSSRLLPNGERQVTGFHLPGDFIRAGKAAAAGRASAFTCITDCVTCEVPLGELERLRTRHHDLSRALEWDRARDLAILEQMLVSIGRRSALARVAHMLLELDERLRVLGQATPDGYRCPLTQELIGDALGLTHIHVNRMLRQLRDHGLASFRNGHVSFIDRDRLVQLAEFDPTYLG